MSCAGGGRALLLSEERAAGLAQAVEVELERLGEQRYLLNGQRDAGLTRPGWTALRRWLRRTFDIELGASPPPG